jgi:acyl-CoA synthetase (AMP-forming)/AMP-acid ligase II
MGLIGCWLFSLYFGVPIAALSPQAFLRRPERWLWTIHAYRGSLSPAPNFAYELCVRRVAGEVIEGLDLSSWRVALNGAEPVSPRTLARFTQRYAPYGFRPEVLMPVYGLAESTVALSFHPLGKVPRIDRVRREPFLESRRAEPASDGVGEEEPLHFPSVGTALPGHSLRIVDDADQALPERVVGHLQFRGLSALTCYYRNPEATAAIRTVDGWWRSGDLGYLAEGELFITGRQKDLIIKAGRNIHPHEVEEVAAEVAGVRRGCVAAFSVPDPKTGSEGLVLVAETRETRAEVRKRIVAEIGRRVGKQVHVSPDVVELVPPQTVPKTPSGKLRRDACRRLYLSGALESSHTPVWWQLARLAAGNAWVSVKRIMGGQILGR